MTAREAQFSMLVAGVMDYAIFMLDTDGIVQTWNAGAQRLKGYTADEIIGQSYRRFYPDEDREDGLPDRLLARALEEGRAAHSGWRVRKDGTRFWADVVITALRDDDGRLTGFAKVTRDMTEAHRLQQEREQALQAQRESLEKLEAMIDWRRDFIAGLAHDLQNPVTTITAFADALIELTLDAAERRRIYERILSNSLSLQGLIDQLRASTSLDSNRVELRPEPIALGDFVTDLTNDMEPALRQHDLRLDLRDVRVEADRRALERILRNLLTNAARYSPAGTVVEVSARDLTDEVEICVCDEGPGIPDDLLPKIFDQFERGHDGGTGLGLAIVKQYVELHGGGVAVDSTPGGGTTFRLAFPSA